MIPNVALLIDSFSCTIQVHSVCPLNSKPFKVDGPHVLHYCLLLSTIKIGSSQVVFCLSTTALCVKTIGLSFESTVVARIVKIATSIIFLSYLLRELVVVVLLQLVAVLQQARVEE